MDAEKNDGLTGEQVTDFILKLHTAQQIALENTYKEPLGGSYYHGREGAFSATLAQLRRMGVDVDAIIEAAK
jgi:hypothetical protein